MKHIEQTSDKERLYTITISLITTFLSLIPSFYVTIISNSSTLLADLLRCVVEFLAILTAFIVTLKTKPQNLRYYNYGFGKLEHLSSIAVAGAMLVAFMVLFYVGINKFLMPAIPENTIPGLALSLLSVAGNLFLCLKNINLSKKTPSPIAVSQARLFRSKTFASAAVTLSLLLGMNFPDSIIGQYADAAGTFAVAAFLFYSGYELVFRSLGEIIDRSLEEGAQLLILKALIKFEANYSAILRIRTRRGGDKDYIELWLEFNGEYNLNKIQALIMDIKNEIKSHIRSAEILVIPVPYSKNVKDS